MPSKGGVELIDVVDVVDDVVVDVVDVVNVVDVVDVSNRYRALRSSLNENANVLIEGWIHCSC